MYAKLFSSLYQGTLRGRSDEILVFTNLIAHTGKDGTVDKHFKAIAEETGLSLEAVKDAINNLEAPDPESRSPEENGARIVRLDEHRVWGWRVVNHGKYRAIRSEDDRAEQNRLSQKRWRERHKQSVSQSKPGVSNDKPSKPKQRQEAEAEAEAEAEKETPHPPDSAPPALALAPKARRADTTDEAWLQEIGNMDAFKDLDVKKELGKAQLWCSTNRRQCNRRFFTNWLNRAVSDSRTIAPSRKENFPGELERIMQKVKIIRCSDKDP